MADNFPFPPPPTLPPFPNIPPQPPFPNIPPNSGPGVFNMPNGGAGNPWPNPFPITFPTVNPIGGVPWPPITPKPNEKAKKTTTVRPYNSQEAATDEPSRLGGKKKKNATTPKRKR